MKKLKDAKGRILKEGARVRGKFLHMDIEVHGIIKEIYKTRKHGWVLAIEEIPSGKIQNLPASQCRRMYGETKLTKAKKSRRKKKS